MHRTTNLMCADKEAFELSQPDSGTLNGDRTGNVDPLLLTDLPDVGYSCSVQYSSPDMNSITGHSEGHGENSTDSIMQPLPPWCPIQNLHNYSPSARPQTVNTSWPASPHQQVCRVCNDTATGKHFGVMTCEACKSFFRRSIRAEAKYVCKANSCCEIDKSSRNKCQHCRLQKCVDVGMRKNGMYQLLHLVPTCVCVRVRAYLCV